MMLAIQAEQEKLLRQLSPDSNAKAFPGQSQQNSAKFDPKNISGGPFNEPPRSDYSAAPKKTEPLYRQL